MTSLLLVCLVLLFMILALALKVHWLIRDFEQHKDRSRKQLDNHNSRIVSAQRLSGALMNYHTIRWKSQQNARNIRVAMEMRGADPDEIEKRCAYVLEEEEKRALRCVKAWPEALFNEDISLHQRMVLESAYELYSTGARTFEGTTLSGTLKPAHDEARKYSSTVGYRIRKLLRKILSR